MRSTLHQFIGIDAVFASSESCALLEKTQRLAPLNASVLIEGESGSGKEVLARALHAESLRASKPWVDLSCAALPDHLVESELFGYEKGAFSGADRRKEGLFELAHQGTIFLDEVGELPARQQAKLLRILDSGSYYRLGGTKKVDVDVRVIAATNRNLRDSVEAGEFRKDLYHRLAQLRLRALPLRERPEDILPIAELFLSQQRHPVPLSQPAKAALIQYCWPGNVRELRNAVVSAAAMATGAEIELHDLPEEFQPASVIPWPEPAGADLTTLIRGITEVESGYSSGLLEQMERKTILAVLKQSDGHQERAARLLGISVKTLSRKLKVYSGVCHETIPAVLSA